MGGQGFLTSTLKAKKRNKLPGISATQKSVADFFTKRKVKGDHQEGGPDVCEMGCLEDDDMYHSEATLEKQLRFEMVRMCRMQWAVSAIKVPIRPCRNVKKEYPVCPLPVLRQYSLCDVCGCPADRCDCAMCVQEVSVVTRHGARNISISQDNNDITRRESSMNTDMKILSMRVSSPTAKTTMSRRITSPTSSKGEQFSSEMLTGTKGGRGVSRQPTEIRKLFIPKSQVRKKSENENKQSEEHALYLTHNQNWRQKLERFQPDKS